MNEFLVWQLVDSGFPAGSFAHSFGLEAAWHQGEVDAASLRSLAGDAIRQAGASMLPFVTYAHAHPDAIGEADERCEAFLRTPVANRASRIQGRAWLATIAASFPAHPDVVAVCAAAQVLSAKHHAVVFGATISALAVGGRVAQRMFLFGVCRGLLAAAVRLGIVGTTEAQRIIAESEADLESTAAACSTLTMDEAAQTAPLLDLWQSSHDRLYSRLFQS